MFVFREIMLGKWLFYAVGFEHKSYFMRYNRNMVEIQETSEYSAWFADLKDRTTRARINVRIRRLALGNPGDVKPVGEGVSELRIDFGPGFRIYFIQRGEQFIVLLGGGSKATQPIDISAAIALARALKEQKS